MISFSAPAAGARHDLLFKVVFGKDVAPVRFFGVSKMTLWRWRPDKAPLPTRVIHALPELLQERVAEARQAQTDLFIFFVSQ